MQLPKGWDRVFPTHPGSVRVRTGGDSPRPSRPSFLEQGQQVDPVKLRDRQ